MIVTNFYAISEAAKQAFTLKSLRVAIVLISVTRVFKITLFFKQDVTRLKTGGVHQLKC